MSTKYIARHPRSTRIRANVATYDLDVTEMRRHAPVHICVFRKSLAFSIIVFRLN